MYLYVLNAKLARVLLAQPGPGDFPVRCPSRLQRFLPFQITTFPWKPPWHLCSINKGSSGPRQSTCRGCIAEHERWLSSTCPTNVSTLREWSLSHSLSAKPPSATGSGPLHASSQAPITSHLWGVLTTKARIALSVPGCCLSTPNREEPSLISFYLSSLSQSCSGFPCQSTRAPPKPNSCLTSLLPRAASLERFRIHFLILYCSSHIISQQQTLWIQHSSSKWQKSWLQTDLFGMHTCERILMFKTGNLKIIFLFPCIFPTRFTFHF